MAKTILIGGAILIAIIILVPVAILLGSDSRTRKLVPVLAGAATPVAAKVPLALAQVRARLEAKLGVGGVKSEPWKQLSHPEYGPQFGSYYVTTNETGTIDMQFRFIEGGMSGDAPISTGPLDLETQDPGLPAYLQLPEPQRKHDLLIRPQGSWTTPDYQKNAAPLPYSSQYFLHLEALGPDETRLTVLGYNAMVTDGQRWSVTGDMFFTAPRRVDNVLYAPPSPADKRAMLDNLLKLIGREKAPR